MPEPITRERAQKILDADIIELRKNLDAFKQYYEKLEKCAQFVEENKDKLLDIEFIDEENLMKKTRAAYNGNHYRFKNENFVASKEQRYNQAAYNPEEMTRFIGSSMRKVVDRTIRNRTNMQISAHVKGLNQKFTVGAVICIDKTLKDGDLVDDVGVCFERKDFIQQEFPLLYQHRSHSYGGLSSTKRDPSHYKQDFTPPPDAFDIVRGDENGKCTYKQPTTPSYEKLYKGPTKTWRDEDLLRLGREETALVIDVKSSKRYVKVLMNNPDRYVWLRRIGLVVAQN